MCMCVQCCFVTVRNSACIDSDALGKYFKLRTGEGGGGCNLPQSMKCFHAFIEVGIKFSKKQ